jgi:hypothetical protein
VCNITHFNVSGGRRLKHPQVKKNYLDFRMEVMSKSLKNTQVKEQKLGLLQKKCQSIEDKLQDLRRQKKDLQTR